MGSITGARTRISVATIVYEYRPIFGMLTILSAYFNGFQYIVIVVGNSIMYVMPNRNNDIMYRVLMVKTSFGTIGVKVVTFVCLAHMKGPIRSSYKILNNLKLKLKMGAIHPLLVSHKSP